MFSSSHKACISQIRFRVVFNNKDADSDSDDDVEDEGDDDDDNGVRRHDADDE